MNKNSKVYIAGHNGMVGSAIVKKLIKDGYDNLILKTRTELDLISQEAVKNFFKKEKPEYVFLAAALVGGIQANMKNPVEFLEQNILINTNIIKCSYEYGVKKLLFLGSSCIYPRECLQPMKEEYLLSGKLEPTNEGYALSKIVGLKLAEYYNRQYGFNAISIMPPNLYGPNDSFDLEKSHVLSALIRRFVDAVDDNLSELVLWGSGSARREFMHVDDVAEASIYFMQNYSEADFINIGIGKDVSIKELAEMISNKVGYDGKIVWDTSRPDGMPRKCLDVSKMDEKGFKPKITLEQGIDEMLEYYKKEKEAK